MTPTITYAIAIFQLKILANRTTEAKSTNGDEIKNENVTPIGNPADVKPINNGIEEHEQNGVMVPNNAPIKLALIPLYRPKIFRVLSGGK
jgi:hypothetical protein